MQPINKVREIVKSNPIQTVTGVAALLLALGWSSVASAQDGQAVAAAVDLSQLGAWGAVVPVLTLIAGQLISAWKESLRARELGAEVERLKAELEEAKRPKDKDNPA